MNQTKKMLSVSELGEYLGIGRSLAYQLSRQKAFPTVKIGRRVLVPVKELEIWLSRNAERRGI